MVSKYGDIAPLDTFSETFSSSILLLSILVTDFPVTDWLTLHNEKIWIVKRILHILLCDMLRANNFNLHMFAFPPSHFCSNEHDETHKDASQCESNNEGQNKHGCTRSACLCQDFSAYNNNIIYS